jgi:hypothetical protein
MNRWATVAVAAFLVLMLGLIAVPAVNRYRALAWRARCQDNLRRVITGLGPAGGFPPGTVPNPRLPPERRLSWVAGIVPALDGHFGPAIDRAAAWDDPANHAAAVTLLVTVQCPALAERPVPGEPAPTHYVGQTGIGPDSATLPPDHPRAGAFRYDAPTPVAAIRDGVSQTIALTETGVQVGPWIAGGTPTLRPVDPATRPYLGVGRPFGGAHVGGAFAAFADGSARFLSETISPAVWEALVGIADGQGGEDGPSD